MRVGQKQKKIDINIPKLDDFIHNVYIHVARKIYKNVYLFELNLAPLQIQKYNRELEIIVQECIMNTLRESIPVESILRAYMDETVEEDVVEEIKEEIKEEVLKMDSQKEIVDDKNVKISFNDVDSVKDQFNKEQQIVAPKTIDRLEQISEQRAIQRKLETDDSSDKNQPDKIQIFNETVELDNLDVHVINEPELETLPDLIIDDIELLE
jgi:hypothetical protein